MRTYRQVEEKDVGGMPRLEQEMRTYRQVEEKDVGRIPEAGVGPKDQHHQQVPDKTFTHTAHPLDCIGGSQSC